MSKFNWSESKRRYTYASNGRVVPETRIRAGLQGAIDASKLRIGASTDELIGGKINVAEWTIRMREEIKNGHRAAALLANGGKLNPSVLGKLGATVRAQYEFLSRFSSQIQNGEVPFDKRLAARAKMYAQAILPSYENQVRAREQRAGMRQERRVLSPVESCADCLAFAARGWQPIGTLPQIGDSICKSNCHCRFIYQGEGVLPEAAPIPKPALNPKPPAQIIPETFREFPRADFDGAAKYGDQKWGKWFSSLSNVEKRAVQDYVGDHYDAINDYLRRGAQVGLDPAELAEIRQRVASVDKALAKSALPENLILWRGAKRRDLHELFESGELAGKIIQENSYSSTSLNEDVGRYFAPAAPADEFIRKFMEFPTLTKIRARAGDRGAYVSNINREFHSDAVDYHNNEAEILLPKGVKFKILSAHYEHLADGRKLLVMEAEIWKKPRKK